MASAPRKIDDAITNRLNANAPGDSVRTAIRMAGNAVAHATTVIKLNKACVAKPGVNWVSVQNADSAGPWYWEMQNEQQGFAPDWRDVHDAFGSGCTTFNNGRYLVDCLGYPYGDWMFILH